MSQDTHLFSAFKLSARENNAAYLENTTGIPAISGSVLFNRASLPHQSSSMRHSMAGGGPRQSMVPRSSFHRQSIAASSHLAEGMAALTITNQNTLNAAPGSVRATTARKAIAHGQQNAPPTMNYGVGGGLSSSQTGSRKSSTLGLKSGSMTSVGRGGGFVASSTAVMMKDTRPIRDRAYQNMIANSVYEYLINNNFELDMKHSITPKSLKSPTQKDFVMMFQWLFRRLDPGYKFTKSIENEVIPLMKIAGYPYLDTLSKSQLVAVGGQNWGAYLAMLYWLVEIAETFDAFDNKDYDIDEPEDTGLNQIVINYITKSYSAFLQNEDDYSEYEAEMRESFEERIAAIKTTTDEYAKQKQKFEQELQDMEQSLPSLAALQNKGEALESDLAKFQEYIENMEKRKTKWSTMLENINEELTTMEQEFTTLEKEKATLEEKIAGQGLAPADIDNIIGQREQLSKAIQGNDAKSSEITRKLQEKEQLARQAFDSLDTAVQRYTSLGYRIGILPAGAPNCPESRNFEISLSSPLAEENLGARPNAILNGLDLRHEVRPALQKFRMEVAAKVHKAQDESIRLQSLLDRVAEVLADKRDQLDTLEAQISAAKITYDEAFETMTSDASSSHAEIEKLERKIQAMRIGVQDGRLQLEQRAERVVIEYDHMQHAAELIREQMQRKISDYIEKIVGFKLHVQAELEEHENFVVDELERQSKRSTGHDNEEPS
ncbi:HEC/Ndc80p family-domain-containing protein [Lipomyces tetrasporus]|uniref:Kinetochore protein NDC80 n=1 Tax=Lipomyces tetrasporus TaxID=54092 RepID=A0AAD7QVU0_9ASCO|nr:HEC/Ndc80p family-domain-containing protein [Lipomyces tetrasporus]KAJ8102462.1 HEC/Ndc80p family-domain-containing protein [Lipomyces tetrasporus]